MPTSHSREGGNPLNIVNVKTGLFSALQFALDRFIALDPFTVDRLAEHAGKTVEIHLRGLEQTFYLRLSDSGLQLLESIEGKADTRISGAPFDLLSMGLSAQAAGSADVRIEGNLQLGQEIKAIFENLDLDWQEPLSRFTGDAVAYELGRAAKGFLGFLSKAAQTTQLNVQEYLQEEAKLLPTRNEIQHFVQDVTTTRYDVDRLDARINQLAGRKP